MPTGRRVDAMPNRVVDADQKAGRCDADQNGRCYGEFRHVRKSRNVKQSEPRKEPEFRKSPKRKVGGPTRPESTGTPNSRYTDSFEKTPEDTKTPKEPELPTRTETPEVRLKRKISGNLDIQKKESRRPIRNRRPDWWVNLRRKAGSREKLWQMQIRRGARRNRSRRAEEPEEPQVELEGEC
jgi:hypothetical protein